MRRSVRELAARQAALRRRAVAEREAAAQEAQSIVISLAKVDRALRTIRRLAANPLLIAAGIALIVVFGRSRALRVAGAGIGLASTVLRIAVPVVLRLR